MAALKLARAELSRKVYQERTLDGRVYWTTIAPDTVLLTLAEYRPIYVDGDVAKPGSQIYRPGITARQAVSLAGGYENMRSRINNPFPQSSDLRNEHQSLWTRCPGEGDRIWWLHTELKAPNARHLEEMTEAPLPPQELLRAREFARQDLEVQMSRHKAEWECLEQTIKTVKENIALVETTQGTNEEEMRADAEGFLRLTAINATGNRSMSCISEARRLYSSSSTQVLGIRVLLTEAKRKRNDAKRELARLAEDRRLQFIMEREEAGTALANVRPRLEAVRQKIEYTEIIRSQLVWGGLGPQIRITRSQGNATI